MFARSSRRLECVGCDTTALRVWALDAGWSLAETGASGLKFFFLQAEDGIRDYKVTGTCALPISGTGLVVCAGGIACLLGHGVPGQPRRGIQCARLPALRFD